MRKNALEEKVYTLPYGTVTVKIENGVYTIRTKCVLWSSAFACTSEDIAIEALMDEINKVNAIRSKKEIEREFLSQKGAEAAAEEINNQLEYEGKLQQRTALH